MDEMERIINGEDLNSTLLLQSKANMHSVTLYLLNDHVKTSKD